MNPIVKFFHEMMNPHCEHCKQLRIEELEQKELDREVSRVCPSCENLKMQLAYVNQQNNKLIDNIIEPVLTDEPKQEQLPPRILQTNRQHIPFSFIKHKLETESKIKAAEINAQNKAVTNAAKPDNETTAQLETELGIENAGNKSA